MTLPHEVEADGFEPESPSEKRLREKIDSVMNTHASHFIAIQDNYPEGVTEILLGGRLRAKQPGKFVDISIGLLKFGDHLTTTISAHHQKYEITEHEVNYDIKFASDPLGVVEDDELDIVSFWLDEAEWDKSHSERIVASLRALDNISAEA
jgi:hypothetical protein